MRARPQRALLFLADYARIWVFPREPFGVSLQVSADMLSRIKVLPLLSSLLRLPLERPLDPRALRFREGFSYFQPFVAGPAVHSCGDVIIEINTLIQDGTLLPPLLRQQTPVVAYT
jgi:hypothetical protein